eukprot:CAMPEP_0174942330 /NCGR_PEP_ID=MMETSP1355-20121228/74054_1 /TAXON_ID=464990 /ORGANISM="Hemiselmis tepida, Strain CCMP443" /LENGTH=69 /DNA_ID=CAMNT_0016189493 /DNA_START=65 /DNA_END=270 /DNA_ORIENTATION=-
MALKCELPAASTTLCAGNLTPSTMTSMSQSSLLSHSEVNSLLLSAWYAWSKTVSRDWWTGVEHWSGDSL